LVSLMLVLLLLATQKKHLAHFVKDEYFVHE